MPGVDLRRQRKRPGELAMSALHLVVMLARDPGVAAAREGEATSRGREPLYPVLDGDQVAEWIPAGKRHNTAS